MYSYSFNKIRHLIPSELMAASISLESIGINEYVWKWKDALRVIEIIVNNRMPILGGDVYNYMGDVIKGTGDSWFIKRKHNESLELFVERSKDSANEYIKAYTEKNGNSYYFSIVS
jgi:hypothetical protein